MFFKINVRVYVDFSVEKCIIYLCLRMNDEKLMLTIGVIECQLALLSAVCFILLES